MTPQVDSCLSKWENVFVGFWVREIWVKSMLLSHHNQKRYCKTTDWVPLLRPDLILFYPWIYWLKTWCQITLKLGIVFSKLVFVFTTGKLLLFRVYSYEVSGRPKVVYDCQVIILLLKDCRYFKNITASISISIFTHLPTWYIYLSSNYYWIPNMHSPNSDPRNDFRR